MNKVKLALALLVICGIGSNSLSMEQGSDYVEVFNMTTQEGRAAWERDLESDKQKRLAEEDEETRGAGNELADENFVYVAQGNNALVRKILPVDTEGQDSSSAKSSDETGRSLSPKLKKNKNGRRTSRRIASRTNLKRSNSFPALEPERGTPGQSASSDGEGEEDRYARDIPQDGNPRILGAGVGLDEDDRVEDQVDPVDEVPTAQLPRLSIFDVLDQNAQDEGEGEGERIDTVNINDNNPGHNNSPRLGYWDSFRKMMGGIYASIAGGNTKAVANVADTDDTTVMEVPVSKFDQYKGKAALGGIAAVALVGAGLVARSYLANKAGKAEQQPASTRDTAAFFEAFNDESGETRTSASEPESVVSSTNDINSDTALIDYEQEFADYVLYLIPFQLLCDKLKLDAIQSCMLEFSMGTPEFYRKLREEHHANDDVMALAKVVEKKFLANREHQ